MVDAFSYSFKQTRIMKQKLFSLLLLLAGMVQETVAQKEAYVASDDYGNTVTFYYDDQKSSRS